MSIFDFKKYRKTELSRDIFKKFENRESEEAKKFDTISQYLNDRANNPAFDDFVTQCEEKGIKPFMDGYQVLLAQNDLKVNSYFPAFQSSEAGRVLWGEGINRGVDDVFFGTSTDPYKYAKLNDIMMGSEGVNTKSPVPYTGSSSKDVSEVGVTRRTPSSDPLRIELATAPKPAGIREYAFQIVIGNSDLNLLTLGKVQAQARKYASAQRRDVIYDAIKVAFDGNGVSDDILDTVGLADTEPSASFSYDTLVDLEEKLDEFNPGSIILADDKTWPLIRKFKETQNRDAIQNIKIINQVSAPVMRISKFPLLSNGIDPNTLGSVAVISKSTCLYGYYLNRGTYIQPGDIFEKMSAGANVVMNIGFSKEDAKSIALIRIV